MRWLREQILKLWGLFAFAEKVALVATLVGVAVFAMSMAFAALAYRADKEAYLYELQRLRAQNASAQVQAAFSAGSGQAEVYASAKSLPDPSDLGLMRFPEREEIFVVSSRILQTLVATKETFSKYPSAILFLSSRGDLLVAPFSPPSVPIENGVLFGVSSDGVLAFSSGKGAPTAENVAARPSVRKALQSGLSESTTTLNNRGTEIVLAHMEVPNSNLVVFAEIGVNRLMAPFYRALRMWLVYGVVIVLVGSLLAFFATKAVAQPARLATEYLLKIAHGDFSPRAPYYGRDEFNTIFSGIDFLTANILSREDRLKRVGEDFKTILVETSTWETSFSTSKLNYKCASILKNIFSRYQPVAFALYCGNDSDIVNASTLAPEFIPEDSELFSEALEIPVVSPEGEQLMRLSVLGVRPTNIWPETMQAVVQLCQAIVSFFERRASANLQLQKALQDKEISFAAAIQKSLVEVADDVPNVEVARHYIPAEQVGGDWMASFYDDGKKILHFFMGDATGHGVAPSLVTAVVAGGAKMFAEVERKRTKDDSFGDVEFLQNIATELNTVVMAFGAGKINMTMALGSLHCDTGSLSICRLGHPLPIGIGSSETVAKKMKRMRANPYLGSHEFFPPDVMTLQLNSGEGVLLYTDGLFENFSGNLKKKLIDGFARTATTATEVIEKSLEEYGRVCQEGQTADDDVAMLALVWHGSSQTSA